MTSGVEIATKTLLGSVNKAINTAKYTGKMCMKELYLLNIINKLINESTLTKQSDELRTLETLADKLKNKTSYICKVKNRNNEDFRNAIQYNLNIITSTNTKPVVDDITIDYDTSYYIFKASDFTTNYLDAENEPATTIRITSLPTEGVITYNNDNVILNQEINISNVANLVYTHNLPPATSDSFTFQISDNNINKLFSDMSTITLNINEIINQAPSQIGVNSKNINHAETYTFTQADFTTGTTPVYVDPDGDIPEYIKVTSLPTYGTLKYNNVAVTVNQAISYTQIGNGLFTYSGSTTNLASHSTNFTFSISDVGSHNYTSGGLFTFNVAAYVNQAPTVGDNTVTINEGAVYIFTRDDFTTNATPPYVDPEGDIATNLRFPTLPATGLIKLNGVNVTVGQVISFANIDSGLLTYVQDVNAGGTTPSFTFQIQDSEGNWSS